MRNSTNWNFIKLSNNEHVYLPNESWKLRLTWLRNWEWNLGNQQTSGFHPVVKQQLGNSGKTEIIHENPHFVNHCPNPNGDSPLPDPNWPKYAWNMLEKIWDQQLWDRQPQLWPPLTPHHATKFNLAVTKTVHGTSNSKRQVLRICLGWCMAFIV